MFLAAGVGLTAISNQTKPLPLIAGMVALVIGILLICPAAVRTMARFARRAPVTPRVAMRDLGRYQARAGAALAAISLALGIPVAVMLVATAADRTAADAAGNGNLADTQLLLTINHPVGQENLAPNLTDAQRAELESSVETLAADLGDATIIPLQVAVNPANPPAERPIVEIGIPVAGDPNTFESRPVYVASPGLLDYVGIDDTSIPADAEILSDAPGGDPGRDRLQRRHLHAHQHHSAALPRRSRTHTSHRSGSIRKGSKQRLSAGSSTRRSP